MIRKAAEFFGSAVTGVLLGMVVGLASTYFVGAAVTNGKWQQHLIERGLAIYCPLDGSFAFNGECDE